MTDWTELSQELDAWQRSGRRASLWWRDDDAVEPTAALERLLDLARAAEVPLALAVIPVRATPGLAARLARTATPVAVLQHGFAHVNHAAHGEKKIELGAQRPRESVLEELSRGRALLDGLFGDSEGGILVPPWNRIADDLLPDLAGLGYRGLSTFGPRRAAETAEGLPQANTHVDILRWCAPRGFAGESAVLAALTAHLAARRNGTADPAEPTGILTHHLAHDDAAWAFLAAMLRRLSAHLAVGFLGAKEVFAAPRPGDSEAAARGAA